VASACVVAAPASDASACADCMRNAARSLAATINCCTDSTAEENESMAIFPPKNRRDIAIPLSEPCGSPTPQDQFNGNNCLPLNAPALPSTRPRCESSSQSSPARQGKDNDNASRKNSSQASFVRIDSGALAMSQMGQGRCFAIATLSSAPISGAKADILKPTLRGHELDSSRVGARRPLREGGDCGSRGQCDREPSAPGSFLLASWDCRPLASASSESSASSVARLRVAWLMNPSGWCFNFEILLRRR
jgi:hypothetical protein